MRLHKTTFLTDVIQADGKRRPSTQWHSSAAEASKARTAIKAEDRSAAPATEEVDVPVVKAELLAFLNALTK